MIPIKLTIQGLYSYQEQQIIDFSKLTGAGLFGIFGAVGSGKSSVLEAITFALYGEIDRLNSRDGRGYNMMNLKSNDLLIDFEFETGKNQTRYRAIVKGRRNSRKFEDINKMERSALKKEESVWIPIEVESLKDVIGLSYSNFKRTIIIPQGQFQEFLQLGNTERTRMMKELFNLEKFELDNKVSVLESKNNALIQNLQGQLQQLGILDPEQVNIFKLKLEELKNEIGQLNLKISENQKQETELKQIKDLFARKNETEKKLVQLSSELNEIELLEKKITDFEYCLIHFKPVLDSVNSTSQKILLLDKKITEEIKNLKQAGEQISVMEVQFSTIKPEYENREKLRQKAEELDKLIRLAELRQLIEAAGSRLKNGEAFIQKNIQNIEILKQEKEALDISLKTKKEAQPDMKVLSDARSWHEIQSGFFQQLATIETESDKTKAELAGTQNEFLKLFDSDYFTDFEGEKGFAEVTLFLKEKEDRLKQQIAETEGEIQHFKVQQKLESFAVGLQEGEACPVCGSLHHPNLLKVADVAENLKVAENKKQTLEREVLVGEKISRKLSELNNLLLLTEKQLSGIYQRNAEVENRKKTHEKLFQWENFKTIDAVNEAFYLAESLKKMVEQLEKQKIETTEKYEKEIQNKEKYQREIEKIRTEAGALETEKQVLVSQIHFVDPEAYSARQKTEIESEKNSLLRRYSELEKQYNILNDKLMELRKSKDILNGSIAAGQQQLTREKSDLENWQKKFENELVASEFKTTETVLQILGLKLNITAEKQKVAIFRQDLALLQNQSEQLSKEIGERKYDAEILRQIQEHLTKDKITLDQLNRDLGITEKSLSDLQKSLETQAQLQKELEKLQLRAENIKTMKSLFKASGFVNYISSVYLQNLCNAANDRFFKLTRQKLSLEITEDNNFQVRDFMNGGKVRNVKTLSGGQTFQAALSLALALADNIQKITESNQNFFFLDEGFGSLDKESLSIVFDTLKSLRHENRIVGVISHVEEMQQEIEVHLRIVNSDETGSKILESWVG